jgi:hypothetical protein
MARWTTYGLIGLDFRIFFSTYTIHRRHSQRTHTHPYEYMHANTTLRSIFKDCAAKSLRLTKSPQASCCRRGRRLPMKAQTPLNPEKSTPRGVEPRTWELLCYTPFRGLDFRILAVEDVTCVLMRVGPLPTTTKKLSGKSNTHLCIKLLHILKYHVHKLLATC